MPDAVSPSAVAVDGRELAVAVGQVVPAVGTDRKRPELHGVLLEAADGSLRLAASDAHRLAIRELRVTVGSSGAFRVMVAGTALAELVDWLDDRAGDVTVRAAGAAVVVERGDEERSLPTIPRDFPAFDALLAAQPDQHRVVVRRDDLLGVLDRLPDAPFARLTRTTGGLTIAAGDASDTSAVSEGSAVSETIAASGDGGEFEITADPELLLDAAMAFGDAELALHTTTPTAPIVVTAAGGAGALTYLVMPIRVR